MIPTSRTSILINFMIWNCQKKMKQENLPSCLRKFPHLESLIPFLPIPKTAAFRHPHLPLLWLNNLLASSHFPPLQLDAAFRHPYLPPLQLDTAFRHRYLPLLLLNHRPALSHFPPFKPDNLSQALGAQLSRPSALLFPPVRCLATRLRFGW